MKREKNSPTVEKIMNSFVFVKDCEFYMYEAVEIGHNRIPGEVINLMSRMATISSHQDLSLVAVGDPVFGRGQGFTVELGPGLLGQVFDFNQVPFISQVDNEIFYTFFPLKLGLNCLVSSGDILGYVYEKKIKHWIRVPPKMKGKLVYLAPEGNYNLKQIIAKLENGKEIQPVFLSQNYLYRVPMPIKQKNEIKSSMLHTGIRGIDFEYPIMKGSTAIISGQTGTGKTALMTAIAQNCDADVIVFVCSGYRSIDCLEIKEQLPNCVIFCCPLAVKEIVQIHAVLKGWACAQYYRDMGYNVVFFLDSLTHYLEGIAYRHPTYNHFADFDSRVTTPMAYLLSCSGNVECEGRPLRFGSITFISSVIIRSGNFHDILTSARNFSDCSIMLSREEAQHRWFPAISRKQSDSKCVKLGEKFLAEHFPQYPSYSPTLSDILNENEDILEIVSLVGWESLSEMEKARGHAAMLIKELFLRQDNEFERNSPWIVGFELLKTVIFLYNHVSIVMFKTPTLSWITLREQLSVHMEALEFIKKIAYTSTEEKIVTLFTTLRENIKKVS